MSNLCVVCKIDSGPDDTADCRWCDECVHAECAYWVTDDTTFCTRDCRESWEVDDYDD